MAEGKTLGVVLAGGKSSRMGADKTQLLFDGKPFVDHMAGLLGDAGVDEIVISGKQVAGYTYTADNTPFAGPAQAMLQVMQSYQNGSQYGLSGNWRALFVPADMPLLEATLLQDLLAQQTSCYFGEHYLPCVLDGRSLTDVDPQTAAVKHLLCQAGAAACQIPEGAKNQFFNINTPEDFAKVEAQCS